MTLLIKIIKSDKIIKLIKWRYYVGTNNENNTKKIIIINIDDEEEDDDEEGKERERDVFEVIGLPWGWDLLPFWRLYF